MSNIRVSASSECRYVVLTSVTNMFALIGAEAPMPSVSVEGQAPVSPQTSLVHH